jgi:hypothetical protein
LITAFILLIGIIATSFHPVRAEETLSTTQADTNSLSLTFINNFFNCPTFDVADNNLSIDVISGSIANGCLILIASTDAAAGYTLTIAGPDNLISNNNDIIRPTNGTIRNPTTFASQYASGVWGFAIPNVQIHGLELGFDASYPILAPNNITNTSRYAAVPTTPTPFSITDIHNTTDSDSYRIFFAVATGQMMPTGNYSGLVTFSGFTNEVPIYDCNTPDVGFATGCTDHHISVVLPEGMVGVRYVGWQGSPEWIVSGPEDPLWYHYATREWANAVTFQDPENRELPVGTFLEQEHLDDILGYWVYIPRFEYRLINTGFDGVSHCSPVNPEFCPQAFDIRFVDRATPVRVGTQIGDWHTHPGFQVNIHGHVAGLWMAKYEASLNKGDGTNCIAAGSGICNVTLDPNDTRASTFVPLASTWTNINLLNIHRNVQNIPYMHGINYWSNSGFLVNGLTNASWGAAVYLSQSLYGICSNKYCTMDGTRLTTTDGSNMQKIYNNGYYRASNGTVLSPTNPRYLTGCGPTSFLSDATYDTLNCAGREWHTDLGMRASSTHNASGIFDLAGGAWEYTFSARANPGDTTAFTNWRSSGLNSSNFSFNIFSDRLYFDTDFTNCSACADWQPIKFGSFAGLTRYFGLALAETVAQNTNPAITLGGWGDDWSSSPSATNPWFRRGGDSNGAATSGVFAFHRGTGSFEAATGWRAVIAGE